MKTKTTKPKPAYTPLQSALDKFYEADAERINPNCADGTRKHRHDPDVPSDEWWESLEAIGEAMKLHGVEPYQFVVAADFLRRVAEAERDPRRTYDLQTRLAAVVNAQPQSEIVPETIAQLVALPNMTAQQLSAMCCIDLRQAQAALFGDFTDRDLKPGHEMQLTKQRRADRDKNQKLFDASCAAWSRRRKEFPKRGRSEWAEIFGEPQAL